MQLFGLSTFARTGLCAGIILLLSAPAVPAGSIAKATNCTCGMRKTTAPPLSRSIRTWR